MFPPGNQIGIHNLFINFHFLNGGFFRHISEEQHQFGIYNNNNIVPFNRFCSGAGAVHRRRKIIENLEL
ncbi:hypothetical protein HanIR_Chr02g0093821 [Helianthus annuus]|nr:hypothetical protein HanIR_Chr02g0093821 [Helianthus annuus]